MNNDLLEMIDGAATIAEVLRRRAIHQPNELAYSYVLDGGNGESTLTYGELDRQAEIIAASLQAAEANSQRVLLLLSPGLEYVAAFFGCLYAGAVAVPAYPPRPNDKLQRLKAVVRDAGATVAITTSAILARFGSLADEFQNLGIERWLAADRIDANAGVGWGEPSLREDTVAFIQYTSGSTADPKGVIVSHGNLLANCAMIQQRFRITGRSHVVSWLPPYHDMGLVGGLLEPLYAGCPATLMSPATFLLRPSRWLETISRTRATISGGPNFAYDLCARKITPEQRATLDLSSWEIAFNGAEPVRPATLERFAAVFAECGFRQDACYPCYGLAEATLFVAGAARKSPPAVCKVEEAALQQHRVVRADGQHDAKSLVACGEPVPAFRAAIVDPERMTRCAPGEIGEIWLSGPSIALGYWNRREETDRTFRAYIADTGDGPFLRTGDLGFFLDDQLVIAGRRKDLIILAGRNHYPQDIEHTVEGAHTAVRPGGCAAFSVDLMGAEQLIILAEVAHRTIFPQAKQSTGGEAGAVIRAIRQSVAEQHGVRPYRVLLLKPGSIPKTSSGKIQRYICRSGFLEERTEALAAS